MNQPEWHQWHSHSGNPQGNYHAPRPEYRPPVREDVLRERMILIERKAFDVALKENMRGRFLRITENASGRMNTLIVPATGLKEFLKQVEEMAKASNELPPGNQPPPPPQKPA